MSYANYDHAGWLASQIDREISGLEAHVADIIGMVFGGIYNAPINWRNANAWKPFCGGKGVQVVTSCPGVATYDFNQMTMLVFLCHEARIRCNLQPHARNYWRLIFSARDDGDNMAARHPDLAEAVERFRKFLPADHRIVYRVPATPVTA